MKGSSRMSKPFQSRDQLDALLHERFGLNAFRPGQRAVLDALVDHGAALAVFPTGGGKSLCYQLPALLFDGITIVVSPLIALMKDQIDALRGRGIPAARLDSTLAAAEVRAVIQQLRTGNLKLLYVAPERFTNERFLDLLAQLPIALFAVDEAHCISEWGHNFRPDYLKLADTARSLQVERVLALTATATPAVIADICDSFAIPRSCAIVTGFHRPNLRLRTTPTAQATRDAMLVERLRTRPRGAQIVYVTLQKTAERVAALLTEAGIGARPYHAGMDDAERSAVQEWWQASDGAVVVATIAFGMGIDKADVRAVYHYNLPKSLESYSQEIGRAGRDGAPAVVELLGSLEDVALLEAFAAGDTPTDESLRNLLDELLATDATFDINLLDLANRHDIRPLVLRTALTYLELRGVLRQGTPYYASYKAKLLHPLDAITGAFSGERAQFVADVFAHAELGRTWYTLDPTAITAALGQERSRLIRMLEYLSEQGWIELQVADARQRYTRLDTTMQAETLTRELGERFAQREHQELARVQQVVALVTEPGCQTFALLRYFGEKRDGGCGQCTFCETGRPVVFPPLPAPLPIARLVEPASWRTLCTDHRTALGHPRQQARFLCGLSSPTLTRSKLTKHPWFGISAGHPFHEVLQWCEGVRP